MLRLKCCQNRHDAIELSDGIPLVFGRSPQTKIADKACSRRQIELTADYKSETVTLKQLGVNPSKFNNEEICKGQSRVLNIRDVFYFFGEEYSYEIVKDFKNSEKSAKKRTIDSFFGPSSKSTSEQKNKKIKSVDSPTKSKDSSSDEAEIAQKLNLLKNNKKTSKQTNSTEKNNNNAVDDIWKKSSAIPGWTDEHDILIYHSPELYNSSKIASFDMDGTWITTASGRTFAKDHNDWKILFTEVPGKLKKLKSEGYKIVLITNQLGIAKGKIQPKDFKVKVENILKKVGVPAQVIAITKRGPFRKPNIGVWTWLEEHGNGGIKINMNKSYYVGDAAGRPKDWAPKKKKDFSCTDRLLALNLGLDFKTPEEYFLSQKPVKFNMPEFDPKQLNENTPLLEDMESITSTKQEVVILVGYPASGKSFFCKEYLVSKSYILVNRDTMKTWQKCVAACNKALGEGKSVVIDNTNPDVQSRQRYVECAKRRGCDCRCFVMQTSMEHARHNNRFRELTGSDHDKVPDMVFYQYRKAFKEPDLTEGFSKVVKVNFVLKFDDDELEKKYQMYND